MLYTRLYNNVTADLDSTLISLETKVEFQGFGIPSLILANDYYIFDV